MQNFENNQTTYERQSNAMNETPDELIKLAEWLPAIREFLTHGAAEGGRPLKQIIGLSEDLLNNGETLTPRQRQQILEISQYSRNALYHFNDLLDLARIETRSLKLNLESINIRPIIHEMAAKPLKLFDILFFSEREVQLEAKDPDYLPNIWADQNKLRHILIEVIQLLTFQYNIEKISMTVTHEENWLKIKIMSPKANLESFIDELANLEKDNPVRGTVGYGMGFYVMHGLIKLHGGKLVLSKEENSVYATIIFPVIVEKPALL